jgi:hypothetical protein
MTAVAISRIIAIMRNFFMFFTSGTTILYHIRRGLSKNDCVKCAKMKCEFVICDKNTKNTEKLERNYWHSIIFMVLYIQQRKGRKTNPELNLLGLGLTPM